MILVPTQIVRLYKLLPSLYRGKLFLAGLYVFLGALIDLLGIGVLLPVLLLVLSEDKIAQNAYLAGLYQWGGFESTHAFVFVICLLVFGISLLRLAFTTYLQHRQNRHLCDISDFLSLWLYRLYYSKGFLYIKRQNSHHLINKINAISSNLIQGYFIPFTVLMCEIVVILSILIGLVVFNSYVFLLVVLTFVPIMAGYYRFSRVRIRRYGMVLFDLTSLKNKLLQQSFVGYSDMEMSNSFPRSVDRYAELLHIQNRTVRKNLIVSSSLQRVLEAAVICSVIALIVATQLFTLPSLGVIVGMFALAVYRVLPGLVKCSNAFFMMRINAFSLDILDDLEDRYPVCKMVEPKEIRFEHAIRFDSVSFAYAKDVPVFRNFSLIVEKGSFLGVKGESGSGKSTLFHLLLGFLRPDSGTIYVDETPLSEEYMTSWRKKIGYVSQQLFMVEGSLLDNIVMGSDVPPVREQVGEVLKLASLDRFVSSLPEGVDTPVGEGGNLLSGGQRQRLGIARALYKKAEILLFDEATSSLDEETEQAVNRAIVHLSEVRKDLTILVISHRPESLSVCRKIIEIKSVADHS